MPRVMFSHLAVTALLVGALLTAIFAFLLVNSRENLRGEIHRKIIERDAAVLYPVVMLQLAETLPDTIDSPGETEQLTSVLRNAQQAGMLAVAVFDEAGNPVRAVPATMLFVELPVEDFLELTHLKPISRYHPAFPLDRTFAGMDHAQPRAPVLEVLLPLHHRAATKLTGVARYYIDARPLAGELALIDRQINRETVTTIAVAAALISLVVAGAYFSLVRSQKIITRRNEQLVQANFELTLAAKASAIGQITSHLIHGLQGSVAGLRAVVAARDAHETGSDWATAATYTERMQAMIQETVTLLGDTSAHTTYELTGHELAAIVRKRNQTAAAQKGIRLNVRGGFDRGLDSHHGGLLCLITNNLVQNALDATASGKSVDVVFKNGGEDATITVLDEGHGIPAAIQAHLFEPGRSGRPGGTGLGLAISQLLARQIGATLVLDSTGPAGTTFRVTLPLQKTG